MTTEELYKELREQKEYMTHGERMAAYMRGEEVDYQPYALLAPDDALASVWGYTKEQVRTSFELKCEMIRRKKEEYGFEGMYVGLGLRGIGEAVGSKIVYPQNSTDYVAEHYMMDYDRLGEMEEFEVKNNQFLSDKLTEAKMLMERFPDMGISTDAAGPISTAVALRPIEYVLRDMRKNPEKLHRLLSLGVDCSLKWVKTFYEETGSTAVGFADPVTTTDVLGLKYFKEFSKPYIKKLFDGIYEITGNKPSIHICGRTRKIWDDLLEIGVDNFSLDNCESMEEAKSCLGHQMFLSGNVSPVDIMRYGSVNDVIEAVRNVLLQASDSPSGFMISTGCQIPIGTPKQNMDAYVYAVRKYGYGARKGERCKGLLDMK
ncbi:MAG: uroporphyrinogen decarboxylase family protein [Eubacteriales bacterium]|nr:uroporphyrinogen decarboxylase family protein [Eubacteriales bacterium]